MPFVKYDAPTMVSYDTVNPEGFLVYRIFIFHQSLIFFVLF